MGLSAGQIGELVRELEPLLCGAEVLAVQPLPPRDLELGFARSGGESPLRLRLSADPEAARIHLQVRPGRRHRGSADPFYGRVAEALTGCVLHALQQVQGDRIVRLSFRREGRPAAELLAELTGRHANLLLLDGSGRILTSLIQPAGGTAAAARLLSGAVYALPPGRRAPGAEEPDASRPPTLIEAFAAPEDAGRLASLAPLSARVDAALGRVAEERFEDEHRRELVRRLERRLSQADALVAGLETRARACDEAERLRMDAELLLAHLATIARGAAVVELVDAFADDGRTRTVRLDPGLSARRNADKLFARYKKLRRTLERLPEEMAQARAARERVALLLERARQPGPSEEPAALAAEAVASGLLGAPQEKARKPAKSAPRLPYLRFLAVRGSEIRVGRTAADNDRLTFRESNGNDLWLHSADTPGSHVVLRLPGGREPDDEEVLDAAHLAVHFSPLRGSGRADVHVARRKEVHKPRRAAPGLVTLSGGRVRRVRMEPARLERLLRGRGRTAPEAPAQEEDA